MGLAAAGTLLYTRGHIEILLVMYSLNVFLTFSLSQSGMVRFWLRSRRSEPLWKRHLFIHGAGLVLCSSMFCVMLYEKFTEGAWITFVITLACITACVAIRRHYRSAAKMITDINQTLLDVPLPAEMETPTPLIFDPKQPTAAILVGDYNGLGLHVLYSVFRLFPGVYTNVVFVSVGLIMWVASLLWDG